MVLLGEDVRNNKAFFSQNCPFICLPFSRNPLKFILACSSLLTFSAIRVAEVTWSDMLTTRRTLVRAFSGAAVRDVARAKSIGFIGLGRMGSEMALNLFSKRFTEAHDSEFVVCDAIPDSAQSFCDAFLAQFPVAHLRVVLTPAE